MKLITVIDDGEAPFPVLRVENEENARNIMNSLVLNGQMAKMETKE